MAFISLHYGGKMLSDTGGAYYTKDASNSFMVPDDISLLDLKSMVYRYTGYDPERCNLELATRYCHPSNGKWIIAKLQDESTWRGMYGYLKSQGNFLIEIYARRIPIEPGVGSSGSAAPLPDTPPEPHSPRVSLIEPDPETYNYVTPPAPQRRHSVSSPPRPQRGRPRHSVSSPPRPVHVAPLQLPPVSPYPRPAPVDDEIGSDFENINEIPDDLSSGDEFEGETWDSDHLEGCGEDGPVETAQGFINPNDENAPLTGRTDTHPFPDFNDVSEFREADIGYYGQRIQYKSELAPNQYFKSKDDLKKKIKEHHVNKNQEIRMKRSDNDRVHVVCKDTRCGYELRAKSAGYGDAWVITKQDKPHTCRTESTRTDNECLTASLIADVIRTTITNDPCISIQGVANCVLIAYGNVRPKYNRLWRGRELAIARQFGSWESSYSLLRPLLNAICNNNPGSKYQFLTSVIRNKETGEIMRGVCQFRAVAWAFGPCIAAFRYLRPVISIDACFLSGRYEGRLLIACGYDAENQLLPLAFAIVRKEDTENWGFFLQWFREVVLGSDKFVCVISDQHKGIKAALTAEYGWSPELFVHRFCMQHVADNLVQNCGKEKWYGWRFREGARKKKPRRLREMFEDFAQLNPRCNAYLRKVGKVRPSDPMEPSNYEKIFQTCDGGYRFGIMTTNGSEALNNVFRTSRRMPVAGIVEDTFYTCNRWFVQRRQRAMELKDKGQVLSDRVLQKIRKRWKKAEKMNLVSYTHGLGQYSVSSPGEYVPPTRNDLGIMEPTHREFMYVVTRGEGRQMECTCRGIQLTSIPCAHALAVCRERNWTEDQFVADWYTVPYLESTWSGVFNPIGNMPEWPPNTEDRILPSRQWIRVGRRKHIRHVMTMDELQGRRRGHQPRRSTTDRQQREARMAGNEYENVPSGSRGLGGSRRSTATGRLDATAMFAEAMGEAVAIGGEAVGVQGEPAGSQPRRSTSRRATRASGSQAGPSGTQAGPSERQAEPSGTQAGPSERQAEPSGTQAQPSGRPSSGTGFFRGWSFRRGRNR